MPFGSKTDVSGNSRFVKTPLTLLLYPNHQFRLELAHHLPRHIPPWIAYHPRSLNLIVRRQVRMPMHP